MAVIAIPAAISLVPAAIEGIAATAAVVAGGWALASVASSVLKDLQQRPIALTCAAAPPPPPPPPPDDLMKKLVKKAMKRAMEASLAAATAQMIIEIKKDKESNIYNQENVNVRGPMQNRTQLVELKLKDQHVWCGHFESGPPPNNRKYEKANKNQDDVIWHRGVPPSGSKAGVAYSAHSRQWILAWHVPLRSSSSSANKIYVECGPERPIDWNAIEKRLDASSNESECDSAVDGAQAKITDGADAAFTAIFYEYTE